MILRARIVLPITAPPVEDGAVLVSGDRIVAVGAWTDLRADHTGPVHDLGDVVLLPGLVDAHCHLDYTHLAGQLAPPRSFPDWIKAILAAKNGWGFSEFAASWLDGARQLLRSGTTTVADIASVPELLDVCRGAVPLRVWSFIEMTGVRSQRPPAEILAAAEELIRELPSGRGGFGLSPHAPYSTTPGLLRLCGETMRRDGRPVSSHVAESQAEFEMFMFRRGPMFEWLEHQRPMDDCGHGSPVRHLDRCGLLGARHLLAHVNYLWDGDARLLAERGASVVHCPQSHAYFRHHRFPRTDLAEAGVNLCLGTDSLASTRFAKGRPQELSLFDEMRVLAATDSQVSPDEILAMATVNGARALGLLGEVGAIAPGHKADLVAVPFSGELLCASDAVVHHEGDVAAAWIDGIREWCGDRPSPATPCSAV